MIDVVVPLPRGVAGPVLEGYAPSPAAAPSPVAAGEDSPLADVSHAPVGPAAAPSPVAVGEDSPLADVSLAVSEVESPPVGPAAVSSPVAAGEDLPPPGSLSGWCCLSDRLLYLYNPAMFMLLQRITLVFEFSVLRTELRFV